MPPEQDPPLLITEQPVAQKAMVAPGQIHIGENGKPPDRRESRPGPQKQCGGEIEKETCGSKLRRGRPRLQHDGICRIADHHPFAIANFGQFVWMYAMVSKP
jgi:hypothetical protein